MDGMEGEIIVNKTPDFESIKCMNPYGTEYWSARDLAPLLGYNRWERFEVAVQRAMVACEQAGQIVDDHFRASSKMVSLGSRAERGIKDYLRKGILKLGVPFELKFVGVIYKPIKSGYGLLY